MWAPLPKTEVETPSHSSKLSRSSQSLSKSGAQDSRCEDFSQVMSQHDAWASGQMSAFFQHGVLEILYSVPHL